MAPEPGFLRSGAFLRLSFHAPVWSACLAPLTEALGEVAGSTHDWHSLTWLWSASLSFSPSRVQEEVWRGTRLLPGWDSRLLHRGGCFCLGTPLFGVHFLAFCDIDDLWGVAVSVPDTQADGESILVLTLGRVIYTWSGALAGQRLPMT